MHSIQPFDSISRTVRSLSLSVALSKTPFPSLARRKQEECKEGIFSRWESSLREWDLFEFIPQKSPWAKK